MKIDIHSFEPSHIEAVLGLLREFAEYEDLTEFVEVDAERIERAFFAEGSVANGLVATAGDEVIGYAFYFPNFASFRGQRGIYLEDIYVRSGYRGGGVGKMLLREIARVAKASGCERMDFLVLDWNETAIGFYKKLGAQMDESERHFRFIDGAFRDLAS